MTKFVNRAKMTTATTGTGTITLGSAVSGFQSLASAGVVNSDSLHYVIEDTGGAWEIGTGTYTSSGTTLSRSLLSSSTGSLLNLSGNAIVYVSGIAEDFKDLVTGPASATDNALVRFDGTTGKLVQNSGTTLSDTGDLSVQGNLTVGGSTALSDINFTLQDDADTTKQLRFQLSGITTGTTRALTVPDYSGALSVSEFFSTRATAVTWAATANVAAGTVIVAAGFAYRRVTGATAISDMSGWLPVGTVSPDHWAENSVPGTTDMTSAIAAALAYLSGGGVLDGGGRTYAVSTTIAFASITDVRIQNIRVVAIGSWAANAAIFNLTYSTSTDSYIVFDKVAIEGSHLANGINIVRAARVSVLNTRAHGTPAYAVKTRTKATELLIDGCSFTQYDWGETGFDVEANRTAYLIDIGTADFMVANTVCAYSARPLSISQAEYNGQVTGCHFYNGMLTSATTQTLGVYVASSNIIFTGNYFDNGCVQIDVVGAVSGITITGSWFTKSGNGTNTNGIEIINTGASTDLAGFLITDNRYNLSNANFLKLTGTYDSVLRWVTDNNLSNDGGVPANLPIMNIGEWLQYDDGKFTLTDYVSNAVELRGNRSVRLAADWDNNSGGSQSEIIFSTDGVDKHKIASAGALQFGYAQATGGGNIADISWSSGTNIFYISPANSGGTAQDFAKRLQYDPAVGWGFYGPLVPQSTVTLIDANTTFVDNVDATKKAQLQLSSITTGTTRTLTVPDASGTIALTSNLGTIASQNSNNVTITGGAATLPDTGFTLQDDVDLTKQLQFDAGGITTGTTRTLTAPNASGTIAILSLGQTFTASQTFSAATNTFGTSTATGTQTFAGGATASGNTKSVNIGTGGAAGSTTSIFIGPGSGGAGTVQFNSGVTSVTIPTLTLTNALTVPNGGTGASTLTGYVKGNGTSAMTASATIPNTDITGLGTMSTQNASAVAITGGAVTLPDTGFTLHDDGDTTKQVQLQLSGLTTGTTRTLTVPDASGTIALTSDLIPAGTAMLFQQTSAPTGWTKQTTHNDKALRVVSGAASSGGTTAFSTVFTSRTPAGTNSSTTATGTNSSTVATGTVGSTTLTTTQIPSHTHTIPAAIGTGNGGNFQAGYGTDRQTSATGGGGSHTHSLTMDTHTHTFTGTAHTHTFTGTAMDFAVQYVDLIIATKD